MTTYRITPSTSVHTTGFDDPAFNEDTAAADALIVDAGAFLVADGFDSAGASLANTNAWRVTINGSIVSQNDRGIRLQDDNLETSTITVGVEGEVSGRVCGIAAGSSVTIVNRGTIAAATAGIEIGGGATHSITNSGRIEGTNAVLDESGVSADRVSNSGVMSGIVDLGGGNDVLNNSGEISAPSFIDLPVLPVVELGRGRDTFTNTGTIRGGIDDQEGSALLANSGLIVGNVQLGTDVDTFTNFRTVNGQIVDGVVSGVIDLGDGDDVFRGGASSERVKDGNGADSITLGGGNDVYAALGHTGADGADRIDGGTGIDTYDASDAQTNLYINLDTLVHDMSPLAPGAGRVAANTAAGSEVGGAGPDRITNFENVLTGAGDDTIYGSSAANEMRGSGGVDTLFGYGGDDRLTGGAGSDDLIGGTGRDILTGGTEGDHFDFLSLSDSGVTSATRDLVADFEDGLDHIELDVIDAVAGTAANDAFTFIGSNVAFGGHAGELRAYFTAQGQIVEGDVNGDKAADFSVVLSDPGHGIVLTSQDFVL